METRDFVEMLGQWSAGTGPLYRRLATAIESAIRTGTLRPDELLPAERVLAGVLRVSRTTIDAAYQELVSLGFLVSRRGSGTRVATLSSDARTGGRLFTSTTYSASLSRSHDVVDFTLGALTSMPNGVIPDLIEGITASLATDPAYGPFGIWELRETIAQRYTREGVPTAPEQILVTSGGQQAISLLATLFTEPGQCIAVQDSTYFGALDAFRAAGAKLVALDPSDLPALGDVRFVYVMASVHNPTGKTMPHAHRRALLQWARATGTPVVDDMVLADLALNGEVHLPLAATHDDPLVITIGSLSKVAWAALRIGWIRASRATIERLGRLKAVADLGTTPLAQRLALPLLDRLGELRLRCQNETAARIASLSGLLRERVPEWEWEAPTGGFALWVRLPGNIDGEFFAQCALDEGALVTPGSRMAVSGRHRERIRLTALGDPEQFPRGAAALERAQRRAAQGCARASA